jgi:hypothetical protein
MQDQRGYGLPMSLFLGLVLPCLIILAAHLAGWTTRYRGPERGRARASGRMHPAHAGSGPRPAEDQPAASTHAPPTGAP